MKPIIDVIPSNKAFHTNLPSEGFYAELKYMYGDANGYKNVTVGPFPEDKKHLFVEFMNLLDAMLNRYPKGKGGFEGYEDVPGYTKWFCGEVGDTEDDWFIYDLGLETEFVPDNSGCIASLKEYKCHYHDGTSLDKYEVTFVRK